MRGTSIRRKLVFFFSILIFSVISLFLYILSNAFGYLKIYEEDLVKTASIQILSSNIKNNSLRFEQAIKAHTPENIKLFEESINPVWSSWSDVKNRANSTQDTFFQIEAIRYGMIAYGESTRKAMDSINKDQETFVTESLRARRVKDYIMTYLDTLIKIRLNESSKLQNKQKEVLSKIREISFISIAVIGIVSLLFSNFFSRNLTKPIIDLAKNSKLMANGNLNVETIKSTSNDEIGILTESFNDMSTNINIMVDSLKDKANIEKQHLEDEVKLIDMGKSLKEAQFLSLQSQINPHFLFNTLNTISRTSMFEQAPKTVRLIECLSNIFRYNLNYQDKVVTLKEELNILEEYMFIQKTRYGDRINFSINNNEVDTKRLYVPIFTLQPLVENAVKHGIEPKEEGGDIIINITPIGQNITIEVKDTGIGFDTTKPIESSKESTSIGLTNVRKRLSLKFSGKEDFKIVSNINDGTSITFIIPEENFV